jgi:hypothetical protein
MISEQDARGNASSISACDPTATSIYGVGRWTLFGHTLHTLALPFSIFDPGAS